MPTLAQIRTAIYTKLGSVSGSGNVHDYERYADKQRDFKTFYLNSGKISGWHIRRQAKKKISPANGRVIVDNEWRLRGFMSLDDSAESEKTFDNLIEAIDVAFAADDTLGGVIDTMIIKGGPVGIQLLNSQPVMLSGVLCHSAELQLITRHYE